MRKSRIVLVVSLIVAIGIPVVLLVHRSRRTMAVEDYLSDRGFARLERCDRTGPLLERAAKVSCYAGRLGDITSTLAFVTELRPSYVPNGAQYVGDNYVAIYLDVPTPLEVTWPAPRVERVGSATVLVWEGLWSAADTKRHLDEIAELTVAPRKN